MWGGVGDLGAVGRAGSNFGGGAWLDSAGCGWGLDGGCSCCAIRGIRGMLRAFVELCENFGF